MEINKLNHFNSFRNYIETNFLKEIFHKITVARTLPLQVNKKFQYRLIYYNW